MTDASWVPATAPRILFVGLGKMGWPMAANLSAAGFHLEVFDACEDVSAAFGGQYGATVRTTITGAFDTNDTVLTMLPSGRVVAEVIHEALDNEPIGELATPDTNPILLDMSSSDPYGSVELGRFLGQRKIRMIDAPVSGGVTRAQAGTLAILVGGLAADVMAVEPILSKLGSTRHVGQLGAGHAVKALNNLLSACGLLMSGEVLVIARKFGLSPSVVLDAFNSSTGRNNSTENKIGQYVLSGTYASGFSLDLMLKDLYTAMNLAHETDCPSPLGALVTELAAAARIQLPVGADHTQVLQWQANVNATSLGW